MIALISSVPEECGLLTSQLKKRSVVAGKLLSSGRIGGKKVVHMTSGIGKTNAAHATTVLIEKFSPSAVVLFGIGGAYPESGLRVGDIAIATEEIYGDEGVLDGDGFHGMEVIGIPLLKRGAKRFFNRFPLDRKLAGQAVEVSKLIASCASRVTVVKSGAFVTVSACTGTVKRARELESRFAAFCENMEGASVAHVCTLYGAPMVEIRGMSNIVGKRDRRQWDVEYAAENCQKKVMGLVEEL